ncbi:MAG TPA: ABC transporter permease [Devosiaceae bacterium]|jgi:peptide/nickel transport system permease protein
MLRLIAIKTIRALITVTLCVTVVFLILRVSGDPATVLLPDSTPPDTLAQYRARWGLDEPVVVQYVKYIQSLFHGDFGRSFADNRDAIDVVRERIPATLQLGSAAFVLSLLLGLPMGVIAAIYRNTWFDRFVMGLAVLGYSIPNFFLGILLILFFSMQLRLLPSSGSDTWLHILMPVLTLGSAASGTIARFTRTSMIEVMGQSFMRTAQGKGAPWSYAIIRHALPNAAIPIVTVIGFQLGGLIGGALVTETVFAWPGVGRLLVSAVGNRDLAVVQTIVLMVAITMVLANYIVDLTYGLLDPRIRSSSSSEASRP